IAGSVYLPVKDASSVIWPFPQWNSKGRGTGRPLAAAVLGMPHSPTAATPVLVPASRRGLNRFSADIPDAMVPGSLEVMPGGYGVEPYALPWHLELRAGSVLGVFAPTGSRERTRSRDAG